MRGASRSAVMLTLLLSLAARAQEPPRTDLDGDTVPDDLEFPGDTDGDGLQDERDEDDDGDGIKTQFEVTVFVDDFGDTRVAFIETDDDMFPNHLDADDDGDGLLTVAEASDPNDDGNPADARATSQPPDSSEYLPDYLNADDDSDGVPTLAERPGGMDRDSDMDGVPDHLDDDDDNDGIRREYAGDSDGDGVADNLDDDDDDDTILTRDEIVPLRDTDSDGTVDYLDADDDGDGLLTIDERGSDVRPRDTDGDLIPDFLERDDDGDGLLTIDERMLGDHDGDGILDYLDLDDDGDGILTVIERGYSDDQDGDGTPNCYDLDSDGDVISDAEEGLDDDDGDGLPNFLDRTHGSENDAGTPGRDAGADGGGAGGGGDAAVVDAGVDGGGTIYPPSEDDGDSGCAIGRSAPGVTSLWLSVLGFVTWLRRRRRRALVLAATIALAGCDSDDDDDDDGVGLDGSVPGLDSGRSDAGDARTPISDAQVGSECTVEGDVLAQSIYEPEERAFAATMAGDTVHVVYVARVCGIVESGNASGTSIDYLSFRSTGAFGAPKQLAADPQGDCGMRGSPAIAPNGEGGLTFFFTASVNHENELYRQNIADNATPIRLTTDIAADDELHTVAQQLGDGPLIAYTNQFSRTSAGELVTARPGGDEKQIVQLLQNQAPKRLALLAFPSGSGGAIGWVDAHSSSPGVRLRSIDAAGAPRSDSPFDLTTSVGPTSALAFATDGTIAGVAYTVQSGTLGLLRFRRLDSQGLPVDREINLTSPNRSITSISMAVYAKGFVIAFREVPAQTGLPASFRLMFIAENGAVAAERRLADATLGGAPTSQIFVAPDGRLIVLWTDAGAGDPVLHVMRVRCL